MSLRSMKRCAITAGAVAPVVVLGLVAAGPAAATNSPQVPLTGSHPKWASAQAYAGHAAASAAQNVRVYLAPNGGEAALRSFVTAVSTPGNASYRHFLTADQYRARFAPTAAEVSSVQSWLTGSGLHLAAVGSGNRYLEVTGTTAAAERAFHVTLNTYRKGGALVQAPSADAAVPTALAGSVLGVVGLDTAPHLVTPAHVSSDSSSAASSSGSAPPPNGFRNARPCSAYYGQLLARYQADYKTPLPPFMGAYRDYAVCGYVPVQLRGAYGVTGSKLTGQGATVAITDAYAAPTIQRDANIYAVNHGDQPFAPGQFTQSMPAQGFRYQSQCGPSGWYGEETLDVEAVHAMATSGNIRYYASRSCFDVDFIDTLARVVQENRASIVSNSWGEPEEDEISGIIAAYEQVFMQGAAQGIGFFFSSGDSGDELQNTGLKQSDYPTSDPYVTSVGGTSTAIGPSNTMLAETGWGTHKYLLSSDGKSWVPNNPLFVYGSGGGFSNLFNQPAYQRGVVPAYYPPTRAVPDVALNADPTTGMLIGETQVFPDGTHYGEYRIGGTSLASPLMAGMQALATQHAGMRLGFANPRIYALAGTPSFMDVTSVHHGDGNVRPDYANGVDPSAGIIYSVRTFDQDSSLVTTPGWDDVTGIGSPTATYLTTAGG